MFVWLYPTKLKPVVTPFQSSTKNHDCLLKHSISYIIQKWQHVYLRVLGKTSSLWISKRYAKKKLPKDWPNSFQRIRNMPQSGRNNWSSFNLSYLAKDIVTSPHKKHRRKWLYLATRNSLAKAIIDSCMVAMYYCAP